MRDTKTFAIAFIIAGLITKMVSEFLHEVGGHGLFILLFGGEIRSLYISVLWPYEFSYMSWNLPSSTTAEQMAWIYAGGILACLFTSFLAQAWLLLKKKISWYFALSLFWLAFWTLANSTGYLLIGGLAPYGDISELIRLGVLTRLLSFFVGLIAFGIGFIALSWILRGTMSKIFPLRKASLGVTLFWLIIPLLFMVMLANPERNLQVTYLPVTFIATVFSFVIEYSRVLSKQETNANPHNVAEKKRYN